MDNELLKLIAGAVVAVVSALAASLAYVIKVYLPNRDTQFLEAQKVRDLQFLEAQKARDSQFLEAQAQETVRFINAQEKKREDDNKLLTEQRTDFLDAERSSMKLFVDAMGQARADYIASTQAHMVTFGDQMNAERQACEKRAERDRSFFRESVESLAASVRGLSDLLVFQGTKTEREAELTPEEQQRRGAQLLSRGRQGGDG